MLNILINAYACAPHKGSEPGMAWNWIINLANHCQLYVITEGEFRDQIEEAMVELPQSANIKFYYNPIDPEIRKMCWNQGDWRFYYYYRRWQRTTLEIAKRIVSEHSVDVLHQLNMVGYREPGMLWKIDNIPTVWGPIGGFGGIPFSFLSLYKPLDALKQFVKDSINKIQIFSPYILKAIKRTDLLIACNSIAKKSLQRFRQDEVVVIGEVGSFNEKKERITDFSHENPLIVTWIGKDDSRKALKLALEVFEGLEKYAIELHVIGVDLKTSLYKNQNRLANVTFHGWMSLDQVHGFLERSNVFLFPSLFEASGTVVLESLSNGVPVLCHDTCGQGDIIDDTCGIKVPMVNPRYSVAGFTAAILRLYNDRELLNRLSSGATKKSQKLTWEKKVIKMVELYKKAIATNKSVSIL